MAMSEMKKQALFGWLFSSRKAYQQQMRKKLLEQALQRANRAFSKSRTFNPGRLGTTMDQVDKNTYALLGRKLKGGTIWNKEYK